MSITRRLSPTRGWERVPEGERLDDPAYEYDVHLTSRMMGDDYEDLLDIDYRRPIWRAQEEREAAEKRAREKHETAMAQKAYEQFKKEKRARSFARTLAEIEERKANRLPAQSPPDLKMQDPFKLDEAEDSY